MQTFSELIKELRTLPSGDIYEKMINNKRYYYHQYFSEGKRYSILLKEEEIEPLRKKINRRKELVKLINSSKTRDIVLSKHAKELTGYIMSKNIPVAEFEKGVLVSFNDRLCPTIIKRTKSIVKFLKLRMIDMSRTNARILKRALNIIVDEDYKIPLYSYALSISDRYCFKPKNSKIRYQDIKFNNDNLFETSLKGETTVFFGKPKASPEITTTGSFEKGWRYINGEWWLYKVGNNKQVFSEIFCSKFAKYIGVKTVEYEHDGEFIRCKNFARILNFEPLAEYVDDNNDYDYVFNSIYDLNPNIAKDYLKLIFFDSVVNNVDRHNENLGLMRCVNTGEIHSIAPNFDNNLALVAINDTLNVDVKKDGFMKYFTDFLSKNEIARELFLSIEWYELRVWEIESLVDEINIDIPYKELIAPAILKRYNYLKDYFKK